MSIMLCSSIFNHSSINIIIHPLKSSLERCDIKNYYSSQFIYPTNLRSRQTIITMAGNNCNTQLSPANLGVENVPKHVAIILDGSRRWHKKTHGIDEPLTYTPYFEANLRFADLCIKYRIGTATSFVYSLKNLERGKEANDLIFGELKNFLENNVQQFYRKGIKISIIGEKHELPRTLQTKIEEVEEATKDCTNLELMLAVCYAGSRDIVNATKRICDKVSNGVIKAEAIDEALLEKELSTFVSRAPHIDLLIRTGGRLRVSDFLMWHIAQAELYFTDILAPDFGEIEFVEALCSFQQRERTFGK